MNYKVNSCARLLHSRHYNHSLTLHFFGRVELIPFQELYGAVELLIV